MIDKLFLVTVPQSGIT